MRLGKFCVWQLEIALQRTPENQKRTNGAAEKVAAKYINV